MIRVFVTTWSRVGNEITNPIRDYVLETDINGNPVNSIDVVCSMFYADADMNGEPDKTNVVIIVEGSNQQDIENLQFLNNVLMLPPYNFNKLLTEIPQNVKDDYVLELTNMGVPMSSLATMTTTGDVVKTIIKYLNPNAEGIGRYENMVGDFE